MVQLDYTFERRLEFQKEESYNEGFDDGFGEDFGKGADAGEVRKTIKQVIKKLLKGKDIPTIADELEEDEAHISDICAVAGKYAPDYDVDKIFEELRAGEKEPVIAS